MLDKKLVSEVEIFCKENGIDDFWSVINKYIRDGFNVDKYGISPFDNHEKKENTITVQDVKENKEEKNNTIIPTKEPIKKKKVRIVKNIEK